MQIKLDNLGLALEISGDMRAAYEAMRKPVTDREYRENAIHDLSLRMIVSVLTNVLAEIGDKSVEDPSDYASRALMDIIKITPELLAEHMGHIGYGEAVN